tara:strand:+ start:131 stop:403 length:273 start_codon:yes stop_codon:yes gene_type:complete
MFLGVQIGPQQIVLRAHAHIGIDFRKIVLDAEFSHVSVLHKETQQQKKAKKWSTKNLPNQPFILPTLLTPDVIEYNPVNMLMAVVFPAPL